MATTTLQVKCLKCKKAHTRPIRVIEPEAFSPNGAKSVLSQFWCPKCGQVNAIRYEFYRDESGEILARIKGRVQPVGMAFLNEEEED